MDNFCNFSNWRKTIDFSKVALVCLCLLIFGLGSSLFRKLSVALPDCIIHHRAFNAFTQGLKAEHNDIWEKMVLEWEGDQLKPCPYSKGKTLTFDDVKRELAEEEHAYLVKNHSAAVEISPSAFITEALHLEEVQ